MYIRNVKSEKGITLAMLTVYLLVFSIIIAIVTTFSTFFFGRVGDVVDTPRYVSEFNKFVMFFATDIKNYNEATVTDSRIEFKDGPTYIYENNAIYRNNVLIAKNIISCKFTLTPYTVNTVTKNIINTDMRIGRNTEDSVTRNVDFTLRYW